MTGLFSLNDKPSKSSDETVVEHQPHDASATMNGDSNPDSFYDGGEDDVFGARPFRDDFMEDDFEIADKPIDNDSASIQVQSEKPAAGAESIGAGLFKRREQGAKISAGAVPMQQIYQQQPATSSPQDRLGSTTVAGSKQGAPAEIGFPNTSRNVSMAGGPSSNKTALQTAMPPERQQQQQQQKTTLTTTSKLDTIQNTMAPSGNAMQPARFGAVGAPNQSKRRASDPTMSKPKAFEDLYPRRLNASIGVSSGVINEQPPPIQRGAGATTTAPTMRFLTKATAAGTFTATTPCAAKPLQPQPFVTPGQSAATRHGALARDGSFEKRSVQVSRGPNFTKTGTSTMNHTPFAAAATTQPMAPHDNFTVSAGTFANTGSLKGPPTNFPFNLASDAAKTPRANNFKSNKPPLVTPATTGEGLTGAAANKHVSFAESMNASKTYSFKGAGEDVTMDSYTTDMNTFKTTGEDEREEDDDVDFVAERPPLDEPEYNVGENDGSEAMAQFDRDYEAFMQLVRDLDDETEAFEETVLDLTARAVTINSHLVMRRAELKDSTAEKEATLARWAAEDAEIAQLMRQE
ncbi:hypothetical protein MPSEU_000418700 [Mayamaea pseudoterrestris]|nr:hypothetical protein MPSEU_000418700 [Mayamaea pseudoterrestris]